MKITALDFETANSNSASACALGIAIYEDGEILDNFEWYFRPYSQYNYFTFTDIHGITQDDVKDEEEFCFYYERLAEILKDSVIIAHNAMFDLTVLNAVCDVYGLDRFHNPYLDTVSISRKVYPELYNHKLDTVCGYLGIDLSHHNGKSDANGCLMILIKAMGKYGTYDLETFLEKTHIRLRYNM